MKKTEQFIIIFLTLKLVIRFPNGLESVTILSSSSVVADALSTSAFLLGKERALELIENLPDTEAILIDEDSTITVTSGIGKEIPFEREE